MPVMLATAYDSAVLFSTVLIALALHCAGTNSPRCPLFGDVDGDGRVDAVWIAHRQGCSVDLIVQTKTRRLRKAIPEPYCRSNYWSSQFPRVIALRPISAHHGLEPEVLMWGGASNDGIRFFTVWRGHLRPMSIHPEPFPKNEWNVGGFAEAYSLTDCLRPHVIGRAGGWDDLHHWHVFGEIYRVTSTEFVRIAYRLRKTRRAP
jgi:hypothetical protein